MVAVDRPEAPGPVRIEVEFRLSGGDQLRQRFADPTSTAETVQRQSGGHEQPGHARHRPDQGIGVRRHRVRMADEFQDPRLADEGKTPRRPRKQGLEARLVRRERRPSVLPGNAVDPSRVGVQLVAAQHHAARLGLPVDEVVRVTEAGHIVREFGAPDCLQRGVLMVNRGGDDKGSGHRGHLRGPDARCDHHHLGLDPPGLRSDRLDGSRRGQLDPGHPRPGQHLDSELAGGPGQGEGRRMRIDGPVPRHPDRTK